VLWRGSDLAEVRVSSLSPVNAQPRVRVALIVIAIAIIIGVVAAIIGNWLVVVTMVLAILGQVVSLGVNRGHLGRRRRD
jgi:membrane protein YdbS with pleckstrin-like domain